MHDLARFVHHLHLFFAIAVGANRRVVAEKIERIRMRQNLRNDGTASQIVGRLIAQLFHGLRARAARALIRAHDDPFDGGDIVQRLQRDQHDDRRAVRIRDDAFVPFHVFRIDFRNDQRHIRLHAERTRIVDDDRSRLHGMGRKIT